MCVCVCIYMHVYVCIYIYVYVCICMFVYVYLCRHICRCVWVCVYIYRYVYIYMCICLCVCMYICMCVCVSRPRFRWLKNKQQGTWSYLDLELSLILANHFKGPISQQIRLFCCVVGTTSLEKFEITPRKGPNRHQVQKGKIKAELRRLKQHLKEVPFHQRTDLQDLINDLRKKILVTSRAENLRKQPKRK